VELMRALMDRPWRWWEEATPFGMGTLETQEDPKTHMEVRTYGQAEYPSNPLYKGPLYILADGGCFSACEDLLLIFKDNHRAVIIGERSAGSSGQPYGRDLGDGMGVGLSTKRMYAPDGHAFEGVGVAPDVEIHTTDEDLRRGRDPVLARAKAMINRAR
jgi:carboxyl-terminal processing protease